MDLHKAFSNGSASPQALQSARAVRDAAIALAAVIEDVVPACGDRDRAIERIREGYLWVLCALSLEGEI